MYDAETVKEEITEQDRKDMIDSLESCAEVPEFMKRPDHRFREVWIAGCWLNNKLRSYGADEQTVSKIGQVHGQRSFFGNPYKWAATLVNGFLSDSDIPEPGLKLADQINKEHMEVTDQGIQLKFEDPK